jgi:hypothetical protein
VLVVTVRKMSSASWPVRGHSEHVGIEALPTVSTALDSGHDQVVRLAKVALRSL